MSEEDGDSDFFTVDDTMQFSDCDKIFTDREVLSDTYTPDGIQGRSEAKERYRDMMSPAARGRKPKHCVIVGNQGSGKTVMTRHMMKAVQTHGSRNDVGITPLWISCADLSNGYQIAIKIANTALAYVQQYKIQDGVASKKSIGELMQSDYKIRKEPLKYDAERSSRLATGKALSQPSCGLKSGMSEMDVYTKMHYILNLIGGTVILILDDIRSSMDGISQLFFQLSRAESAGNVHNTKIGTVSLTHDVDLTSTLADDVKSSLHPRELRLTEYSGEDIYEILTSRASKSLREDSYNGNVLMKCSRLAMKNSGGDARFAINLLRNAGDIAEENGQWEITELHVTEAVMEVEATKITTKLSTMPESAADILYALTIVTKRDSENPKISDIYSEFKTLTREYTGAKTITKRRVREHLKTLSEENIIQIQYGNGETSPHRYALMVNYESVLRAIENRVYEYGIHEALSDVAANSNIIKPETVMTGNGEIERFDDSNADVTIEN